jgi:putative transposase
LTGLKKNQACRKKEKRELVESDNEDISISKQCELIGVSRSGYYYKPKGENEENLKIMQEIDKQYMKTPFYGVRKIRAHLRSLKYEVNIKRVRRLMRLMGLETIYSKPRLSIADKEHKKYPYLLSGVEINDVNQVWSTDITYIPMQKGFMYLVAVIDWHSRYVLSWRLSNSLEGSFCIEALDDALSVGKPKIFNTDQGVQFTSERFTSRLKSEEIAISMDGRGRAIDNVFVERLWRTLKYEYVYLYSQENVKELYDGLRNYFNFYNTQRPHQSLDYKMPAEVYFASNNKNK